MKFVWSHATTDRVGLLMNAGQAYLANQQFPGLAERLGTILHTVTESRTVYKTATGWLNLHKPDYYLLFDRDYHRWPVGILQAKVAPVDAPDPELVRNSLEMLAEFAELFKLPKILVEAIPVKPSKN